MTNKSKSMILSNLFGKLSIILVRSNARARSNAEIPDAGCWRFLGEHLIIIKYNMCSIYSRYYDFKYKNNNTINIRYLHVPPIYIIDIT